MSNLTPSQEPVVYGAIATALLEVAVIFAPRFGIQISAQEQAALAALIVAAIPIVVAYFVRKSVIPTAPPPPVPPPA